MSEEKELHPAVALLLKRMDSNPQEFLAHEWANAEEAIAAYATEEEKKLVREKLGKLWMDHTHEAMLKHLFKVEEDDQDFTTENTKFKAYERHSSGRHDLRNTVGQGYTMTAEEAERMLNAASGSLSQSQSSIYSQSMAQRHEIDMKKLAAEMEQPRQGGLQNVKGRSYASPPVPKKPYLGQILREPRPLSILNGFFKGGA